MRFASKSCASRRIYSSMRIALRDPASRKPWVTIALRYPAPRKSGVTFHGHPLDAVRLAHGHPRNVRCARP